MCDPLKILDEDTFPFIFQHLSSSDIRKLSQVSKLWFQCIANSKECMKKVIIRIDRPNLQMEILSQSLRQYENFKISPHRYYDQLSTFMQNFTVKNVWINDTNDKEVDHNEYVNFMKSFSYTIEYLQTGDIATKNINRLTPIDFPRLKKLHLSFTNRSAFSIFLGKNCKLESVILSSEFNTGDDEIMCHNNVIIEFLSKNPQIKNLWLLHLEKLFVYDISRKVMPKLRYLTFTTQFQNSPQHVKENFLKFIKSQNCLEVLNFMGCRDKSIITAIWNNSKFRKLFVIDCNFYEEINPNDLHKNNHIEEIDFYLTSSVHAYIFLQSAPNIVKYKIRQLSKQLLEFSIRHLSSLREIKFQSIDSDATRYYKEIKKTHPQFKICELDFFEYLNIDKI